MMLKLYFFKDSRTGKKRNTGIIASSAKSAKKKCKQPPPEYAIVYASRAMTEEEKKVARRGDWVRNRADGGKPEDDSRQGFGMPRKK